MIILAARGVLIFSCLMVVGSLLMMPAVRPGTGEYVINVVTLVIGGLLLAFSAAVLRTLYLRETATIELEDPADEPGDVADHHENDHHENDHHEPPARAGRTKEEK